MKNIFTTAAAVLAAFLVSSLAQASGPKFSSCSVSTQGTNTSLILIGGSETRGTITCNGTDGKRYASNIVIPMFGANLGIGHCAMDIDLSLVSADLGFDLTRRNVQQLIALAEVGPVVPGHSSLAVSVQADFDSVGVSAGIGNVTYGKGCVQLASLRFGRMWDEESYDKKKAEREARRQQQRD